MPPIYAVNYARLPLHMQESAKAYVEQGRRPGRFLFAVLCNNLVEAFGRADIDNADRMRDWALWLYNECPAPAWGSEQKVQAWIDSKEAARG